MKNIPTLLLPQSQPTTILVVENNDKVILSTQIKDFIWSCMWFYERYTLAMMEEYREASLLVAHLELFILGFVKKPGDYPLYFNDKLENTFANIPRLFSKLNMGEMVRMSRKMNTDYETYNFRLLSYIIWRRVINPRDIFIIFAKKYMEGVVELIVKMKLTEDRIVIIANILDEDDIDLIRKCQTYRRLLNRIPEEQQEFQDF